MATCRSCGVNDPLGNDPSTRLEGIFEHHEVTFRKNGRFYHPTSFVFSAFLKDVLEAGFPVYGSTHDEGTKLQIEVPIK